MKNMSKHTATALSGRGQVVFGDMSKKQLFLFLDDLKLTAVSLNASISVDFFYKKKIEGCLTIDCLENTNIGFIFDDSASSEQTIKDICASLKQKFFDQLGSLSNAQAREARNAWSLFDSAFKIENTRTIKLTSGKYAILFNQINIPLSWNKAQPILY